MIGLNPRQQAALLAGLESLCKQIGAGRKVMPRGSLSPKQIEDLIAIVRESPAAATASHRHAPDGGRQRSYNVAGECSVHGAVCIACEITWHLEDGPLDWCRECDRLLAEADELAQAKGPGIQASRRRTHKASRR